MMYTITPPPLEREGYVHRVHRLDAAPTRHCAGTDGEGGAVRVELEDGAGKYGVQE